MCRYKEYYSIIDLQAKSFRIHRIFYIIFLEFNLKFSSGSYGIKMPNFYDKTHLLDIWNLNRSWIMERMWICITSNYDITITNILISFNRCFVRRFVILYRLCKIVSFCQGKKKWRFWFLISKSYVDLLLNVRAIFQKYSCMSTNSYKNFSSTNELNIVW